MKCKFFASLVMISSLLFVGSCSKGISPSAFEVQERTIQGPDGTLYVRISGNLKSNNVLIAIHGGPGMTHDYMLNLESLAGKDFAVVTYDQRGVGRSSSPEADPDNYTLDKYADDLELVRQDSGAESISLFGHSWGGIVAMRYATLYPERVRSIIFMGSGPPTREETLLCQQALVQRITLLYQQGIILENPEPGSKAAERGYLPAYFSDPNFWFPTDDLGNAPFIDERTAQVSELTWSANSNYDLTTDLTRLDKPVLNLWGEDDPVRSIASPAILAALTNAAVETVLLPKCGHFWHECPEEFFSKVRVFLDLPPTP
jgi:proline iminopeptidase